MKTSCIFVIFTLGVIVEGAWWAAAVRPIVLSLGAAYTALNLDEQPFLDFDLKGLLISKNESDENKEDKKETKYEDWDGGVAHEKEFWENSSITKEEAKKEIEKLRVLEKDFLDTPVDELEYDEPWDEQVSDKPETDNKEIDAET